MNRRLNILGINGSARQNSSNLAILKRIPEIGGDELKIDILEDLSLFPLFRTRLVNENTPERIIEFRNRIALADGILICTPEYVFSIPSGLNNAIEWCVSSTVFSGNPLGLKKFVTAFTELVKRLSVDHH